MEKRNLYIVVAVVLVVGLALSFYNYTGQSTLGVDKGACLDTDGGDNKWEQGTARYENREKTYTDYCTSRGGYGESFYLNEYFCLEKIESRNIRCDNGCVDGACVK